jgi:ubiquinone/menaquinone biosynthesis C-methylase UbiE
MNAIEQYYNNYDEENRLLSKHGQVEFLTTMRYIHRYLHTGMRILEVGAGTGRYSLALAHEGYRVDAVELTEHNLNILKGNILSTDSITVRQGNALDLSFYEDVIFDITLVLGPLYHLYREADKVTALQEAMRVTKKGGLIFVAYCMNESVILQYCFQEGQIHHCLENGMLTEDYHCISKEKDVFEMVRTEDIERLNDQFPVERLHLVATDGAAHYMRNTIDAMDADTFQLYLDYHFSTCERQDLIGASNHSLDILKKV